jgi:drug/metabolite transporter superfamily protein YnfA
MFAAYGGVLIALSLIRGAALEGFRPDRWDPAGQGFASSA